MPALSSARSAAVQGGPALSFITDLAAVEQYWRVFEKTADCSVFQTFDWLSEWYRHVGCKKDLTPVIVLGRAAGFILPLAVERRGRLRRLIWLGSDICDYNAPLLAPRFEPDKFPAMFNGVITAIQANPELRFDIIEFEKMPEKVGRRDNPFLQLPGVRVAPFSAHIAMLPGPGGWEQFYATKISGSSRQTDRRKFKNLAKQGTIEFVEPHETADLHRTVDAMIAQKRVSYQRMAVADVFANTGYPEFFHSIATDSRFRDMVHVTRIDVGGVMAATGLAAVFKGCYYLLFSSYDEVYARNSPGRKHMHELLRYAINRNLRIFDFTIGDEPYKLDWSDIHVRMLTYVHGYTLRGLLAVSMKTMRYHVDVWYNRPGKLLRTKRFVKTGKRLLRRTGH